MTGMIFVNVGGELLSVMIQIAMGVMRFIHLSLAQQALKSEIHSALNFLINF